VEPSGALREHGVGNRPDATGTEGCPKKLKPCCNGWRWNIARYADVGPGYGKVEVPKEGRFYGRRDEHAVFETD
jgi:hypothetical protein